MIEKELNLNDDKKEIVVLMEALSNIMRLNLLEQITLKKDLSYGELARENDVTPGAIGFHLNVLFDAGLINIDLGKGLKSRNTKVPRKIINRIVINL